MIVNKIKKVSKRVLEMQNDPKTVWGKAKELEKFCSDLASGKNVDKTHKYVNLPNRYTKKYKTFFTDFDNDPNILAILSSNLSQDAYELYLYPKAKTKSVDYVIKNYTKYFKPINNTTKLRVPY
jgi:hypothetical protein